MSEHFYIRTFDNAVMMKVAPAQYVAAGPARKLGLVSDAEFFAAIKLAEQQQSSTEAA